MNLLFEIPDIVLVVLGAIFVLLIVLVAFIIKNTGQKVKPISEDDRYDNDEIVFDDTLDEEVTIEQKEAKEELSRVFDRMSADLEKQKEAASAVDEFEKEQEENAIISYQELLKQAEKLKADADMYEKKRRRKSRYEC